MCGLFGYVGRSPASPLSIKLLWIYSRNRGKDSTGIYRNKTITRRWEDWTAKTSGDAFDLLYGLTMKPTKEAPHIILGHCRAKSVGMVNEKNTHPFEYTFNDQRWIFAHNGTIKNIDELAKKYEISRNAWETDSQTLGHILVEKGFDVLMHYKGTAAFTLFNETTGTLYLWRGFSSHEGYYNSKASEERPLYIHRKRGGKAFYWASEPLNLATALNSKDNITAIDQNTLYTIECFNDFTITKTEYDRSEVDVYEPVATTTRHYPSGSYALTRRQKRQLKKVPTETDISPQNRAKGRVYYHDGLCFRSGHLMNGIFYLSDDGSYSKDDSKVTYHFFNGYLLKNNDVYNKVASGALNLEEEIQKQPYFCSSNYLHRDFMLKAKTVTDVNPGDFTYICNGSALYSKVFIPKFSTYEFEFNSLGKIIVARDLISITNHWEKIFEQTIKQSI